MVSESELLQDQVAVSIGAAVVIAHQQAHAMQFDYSDQEVSVRQSLAETGEVFWRVDFPPPSPPGVYLRGGGYMVEVNEADGSVRRALFTQ